MIDKSTWLRGSEKGIHQKFSKETKSFLNQSSRKSWEPVFLNLSSQHRMQSTERWMPRPDNWLSHITSICWETNLRATKTKMCLFANLSMEWILEVTRHRGSSSHRFTCRSTQWGARDAETTWTTEIIRLVASQKSLWSMFQSIYRGERGHNQSQRRELIWEDCKHPCIRWRAGEKLHRGCLGPEDRIRPRSSKWNHIWDISK